MRHLIATLAACSALAMAAGCTPVDRNATAQDLARAARNDTDALPDSPGKKALVERLDALNEILTGKITPEGAFDIASIQWYDMFRPVRCTMDQSTRMADFDGDGSIDGLLVHVTLLDQFGDPTKALGSFRIETFAWKPRSLDAHGAQLDNCSVDILTTKDVNRYYDHLDRSFRFPLRVSRGSDTGKMIVQVTYYVPDGSGQKMFAERTIQTAAP